MHVKCMNYSPVAVYCVKHGLSSAPFNLSFTEEVNAGIYPHTYTYFLNFILKVKRVRKLSTIQATETKQEF